MRAGARAPRAAHPQHTTTTYPYARGARGGRAGDRATGRRPTARREPRDKKKDGGWQDAARSHTRGRAMRSPLPHTRRREVDRRREGAAAGAAASPSPAGPLVPASSAASAANALRSCCQLHHCLTSVPGTDTAANRAATGMRRGGRAGGEALVVGCGRRRTAWCGRLPFRPLACPLLPQNAAGSARWRPSPWPPGG